MSPSQDAVYLVAYDDGPVGPITTDRARAEEYARVTGGVVAKLPIIADYRVPTEEDR